MEIKSLSLTSLLVNPENYRFESMESQRDAIDKMVEDQGEKLYRLAVDILENGLSPIDLVMVTPSKEGYVVLEGNRRVVTLKLLNNPTLISEQKESFRKKFQRLKKDNEKKLDSLKILTCAIFNNPADADIWIERKHAGELNGVGVVTWDSQQKQRFEEKTRGKTSFSLQVVSLLKSSSDVPDDIKKGLSSFSITSLDRLLQDTYVREQLGLEVKDGLLMSKVDVSEVVKGLVSVITDISSSQIKVADIYHAIDRKNYIDGLVSAKKPNLVKAAPNQWTLQDYKVSINSGSKEGKNQSQTQTKRQKQIGQRKSLIPNTVSLGIGSNPRINKIFEELKGIPVQSYPNAVAVLLRVFLELSVDSYLEATNLSNKARGSLLSRVDRVVNHMNQKEIASEDVTKGIKLEIKEKGSWLSIDTLNSYVHNEYVCPKADRTT